MGGDPLTLEAFRELHPWPERLAAQARGALEWLWHYDLDADADSVWPFFVDTARLNRALGLSPWEVGERDGALVARARIGGIRHEWVEWPWNWVAGRYTEVVRAYTRGLGRVQRTVYRLDPIPGGSRAYVYMGWIPGSAFGRLGLRIGTPPLGRKFGRVLRGLAAEAGEDAPAVYRREPPPLPGPARARLAEACAELERLGLDPDVIALVAGHVERADDLDLYRIEPRKLAAAWGIDRGELLRVCLHATRIGLFEMSWDVVCPHCRGVRKEARGLGDVPATGSCEVCAIEFGTDGPTAVEITFHVHASVRRVPRVHHCVREADSKPHIKLQHRVGAGEQRAIRARLAPGRYRLRLVGDHDTRPLEVAEGGPDEVTWTAGGAAGGGLRAGPDPRVTLVNDGDEPRIFVVEDPQWSAGALRPVHLFSYQEFRDLFSEQYLAADVTLSVGEQTILFTDMVGSTEFYASRGDPEAFVEVRRHFDEVYEIVREHGGAVVKTIGDAVMAGFSEPTDALRAAGAIMRRFDGRRDDTSIRLRASMNTGPCIAVNLNAGIDFFGNAVNLAAKLQACAGAGEVALSETVARASGVRQLVERGGIALGEVPFESAAAGGAVTVYRWSPAAGDPGH